MKKLRIIPKVTYTNYRKEFPNISLDCFRSWLWLQRSWSGRIIQLGHRHYALSFDFRRDWLADMMEK